LIEIRKIKENKKDYIELLLLGDEQEFMIDKYLERGDMYVLFDRDAKIDRDAKSVCVVTNEGQNTCEIKNLATFKYCQKRGYGNLLVEYVVNQYKQCCERIFVGTGETPSTLRFYKNYGFEESHRLKNFFTDNYEKPIYEEGVQLKDMVYLKMEFE